MLGLRNPETSADARDCLARNPRGGLARLPRIEVSNGDDYGQYGCHLSRGGDAVAGLPMIISVNATVCVM